MLHLTKLAPVYWLGIHRTAKPEHLFQKVHLFGKSSTPIESIIIITYKSSFRTCTTLKTHENLLVCDHNKLQSYIICVYQLPVETQLSTMKVISMLNKLRDVSYISNPFKGKAIKVRVDIYLRGLYNLKRKEVGG